MDNLKEQLNRSKELMGILYEQGSGSNAPEGTTAATPSSCAEGYRWSEEKGECIDIDWEFFNDKWFRGRRGRDLYRGFKDLDINFYDIVETSINEVTDDLFRQLQEVNDTLNKYMFKGGRMSKKKLDTQMEKWPKWLVGQIYKVGKQSNIAIDDILKPDRVRRAMDKKINNRIVTKITEEYTNNPTLEKLLSPLADGTRLQIERDLRNMIQEELEDTQNFRGTKLKPRWEWIERILKKWPETLYTSVGIEADGPDKIILPVVNPQNRFTSNTQPLKVDNDGWSNWYLKRMKKIWGNVIKSRLG